MRLLFSTTLFLCLTLALFFAPQPNAGQQSAQAQTIPAPTPSWSVDRSKINIVVLTVDYSDNTLQQAYFFHEASCQQPLPEETLIAQARAALTGTATGDQIASTLQTNGLLAESVDWQSKFMAWEVHLGDFTASALLNSCTGTVIFAGESIWAGYGERPYPQNPLPDHSLLHLSTEITAPQSMAIVEPSLPVSETVTDAWAEIADLNVVHDVGQEPYQVLAYLYRPATGYVDPAEELAEAQWVFILYTEPPVQLVEDYQLYLPLVDE